MGSIGAFYPSSASKGEEEGFAPIFRRRSGKGWTPPPLSLLEGDRGKAGVGDIKANANLIKRTLLNFGIVVEICLQGFFSETLLKQYPYQNIGECSHPKETLI